MRRQLALPLTAFALCAIVACNDSKPVDKSGAASTETKEPPLPAKATAVIDTTAGRITCELFPQQTPEAVKNFIGLAEGTRPWQHPNARNRMLHGVKLYDGTIFHRVIPGFMIQGGDPAGNGDGGPGYHFNDELRTETLRFDRPGRLAYANEGPNTNGSQFFITEKATPHLDGRFTIFGQCDAASVAVVKKIARMPRDTSNDRPFDPVKIEKVTIERGS